MEIEPFKQDYSSLMEILASKKTVSLNGLIELLKETNPVVTTTEPEAPMPSVSGLGIAGLSGNNRNYTYKLLKESLFICNISYTMKGFDREILQLEMLNIKTGAKIQVPGNVMIPNQSKDILQFCQNSIRNALLEKHLKVQAEIDTFLEGFFDELKKPEVTQEPEVTQ